MNEVKIEASWKKNLAEEFNKKYFREMANWIREEIISGKIIYPPGALIFNAFDSTPFNKVKVVILGQDPYHNPGEAMGLCFSVPRGIKIPPSLRNIYQELRTDLNIDIPSHGDLSQWAGNGVFLLNAMLTVEKNKPASHREVGWQQFTDAVIANLSNKRSGIVFMLWGNFAKNKAELIDNSKHLILSAAHPSPFSANNGFFGCKHFSKANAYLVRQGQSPVDWQIS